MVMFEHMGVAFPVDKFDETVDFYLEVCGFTKDRENPGGFVFLSDGQGGYLEVWPKECEPIPTPHHFGFAVSHQQLDELVKTLDDRQYPHEEPRVTPAGDTVVYFNDPSGNRAQFIARAEALR